MEKIKIDNREDVLIIIGAYAVIALISLYFFHIDQKILFYTGLFVILYYLNVARLNRLDYLNISFEKETLSINNTKISWDDLIVELVTNDKQYLKLIIMPNEHKIEIIIRKNALRSFVNLVKKYCPQDHVLYKIVEEYARENKIPFGNEAE